MVLEPIGCLVATACPMSPDTTVVHLNDSRSNRHEIRLLNYSRQPTLHQGPNLSGSSGTSLTIYRC